MTTFAPEASRAVPERVTRQPSIGSHGGQYDVVVLTSKTFQIMQQHIYYTKYALQFADMQIPELVNTFNALIGNLANIGEEFVIHVRRSRN